MTAGSQGTDKGLTWPKLIQGNLIRRYQRFKADVRLRTGRVVTAHCANSGSMKTCSEPGSTVYLSRSANPARRFPHTWELIQMPTSLVGVNTGVPNRLVEHGVRHGQIQALTGYEKVLREVRCGSHSRLDLMLDSPTRGRCFVEVKNCTLVEQGIAYFPDAVTSRGLKHLAELQEQVRLGVRGVIFFLIQRMDAYLFRPADHIDPDYGAGLRAAVGAGVELLAYDVTIDLERIAIHRLIPFQL